MKSSLIFDGGNFFQGHPISDIDKGKTIIDFMNKVGYTAAVPGPFDFIYGSRNLNYLKKISKIFGFSIILSLILFEINAVNKQVKAEKNLIAATEKDIFLYRQMGASYLCIASRAEVDFKKGKLKGKKLR